MSNTARRGDFRNYRLLEERLTTNLDQKFEALKTDMTVRMAAMEGQMLAAIAALEARKQAVDLGNVTITVGALLSVTTAGAQRMVVPFAGVRPTDVLWARPDEYLPAGYGLPQVMCRNAGQLEVRIVTPTLALGTTRNITMNITALR